MPVTSYLVAIGSNRRHHRHGLPGDVVAAAMVALSTVGEVERRSTIIRSAAMGPAGRDFANAAVLVRSSLDPPAMLCGLKRLEGQFGRRRGRRWGQRVLDLDIIFWSGGTWQSPGLFVPHPGAAARAFVLQPLSEIAAQWRHPVSGLSVRHLYRRLTAPRPKHRGRACPGGS
ncbi:2-amino-4-hydroxy-6-hydroxymethyldihydropteridine diphosphokinase [Sphingomonas jejuensis]|uniref:2-amino-4-hydroxy-6-hydroxymethyldihydropteridine pyrophosphokinase n=1 Tax=Sphingomonas jejuensis TaxID=904715 RepID=A0ABX0XLP2_9SPHN|nr:2-amino-4-hydroxy-6-hydroxymethyldihydropteridine diphosphokinase [Sphingomonas jejuensis]